MPYKGALLGAGRRWSGKSSASTVCRPAARRPATWEGGVMLSDRTLGPLPDTDLVKELGLDFLSSGLSSPDRLHQQARESMSRWHRTFHRARQRVGRLALTGGGPFWWQETATLLVKEAHRAGLRVWLSQALAAEVPVPTRAALCSWCHLQFLAFDVFDKAGIANFCVPKTGLLLDQDLLRLTAPYFSATSVGPEAGLIADTPDWEDMPCYTLEKPKRPSDPELYDPDEYLVLVDQLRYSGISVPSGLSKADWQALVSSAWNYARHLAREHG